MLILLLLGGIFMLVGGLVLAQFAASSLAQFFSISGVVVALLLWGVAVWTWRGRDTALVIDTATGEVRFGDKLLCEAGTVQAVVVRRSELDFEEGTCGFEFVVPDGVRTIPSPLFTAMAAETANEMARAVAAVLKVTIEEPS